MIALALVLHVLSAVVWVGGMFFAYICLRPVAGRQLGTIQFQALMIGVFERFLAWVWIAVTLLLVTGLWMGFERFGPIATWPPYVHVMLAIGVAMMLLFFHVYFATYRRLRRAFAAGVLEEAGGRLATLRRLVAVNLALGVAVIVVAAGGRML